MVSSTSGARWCQLQRRLVGVGWPATRPFDALEKKSWDMIRGQVKVSNRDYISLLERTGAERGQDATMN